MNERKIILNADQLRNPSTALRARGIKRSIIRNEIYIVLDNVLDTYNIGSIFRLADAVAAKKIYLCGATETPPNHRIKKASINTTEWVEWEYCETALEAIAKIRQSTSEKQGGVKTLQVIAVEQSNRSIHYNTFRYRLPICLVMGNETTGISRKVLKICDGIVELPMFGVNKSLNVVISLGIVLYQVLEDVKDF